LTAKVDSINLWMGSGARRSKGLHDARSCPVTRSRAQEMISIF
jgi:hypothetical protein